ncbi:MAG: hydroxymethylbilane synthase [Planctomycetota bacterium]
MRTATERTKRTPADQGVLSHSYLPLGLNVAGLPCLVIGGGRIGARKAKTLAEGGALVTVLSPDVVGQLDELINDGTVDWIRDEYSPSCLAGVRLVVAATADPALNLQIGRDAEAAGVLSCLASPGRESRVIFPAVCRSDGMAVAVHSDGRDCARSRRLRDEIGHLLDQRAGSPAELGVVGLDRVSAPSDLFEQVNAIRLSPQDFGRIGIVVLSTCQRWECYFAASSPRAIMHDILDLIRERAGVLLDSRTGEFYAKLGAAALHHLVRVAAGLESPLLGETEIVGQVHRALSLATLDAESPLRKAFASVLLAQKAVRRDSGLGAPGASWAAAAASFLAAKLGTLDRRRVLLVGCGHLGEVVTTRLVGQGANVLPFSHRAPNEIGWCRQHQLDVRAPDAIPALIRGADAIVLTNRVPPEIKTQLQRDEGITVLDLTGNESRRRAQWYGLADVGCLPLSGADVARAVEAGKLAAAHALRLHVRGRSARSAPGILRVGARGSRLSLAQFDEMKELLGILLPETELRLVPIDTPGDRDKSTPLPVVGDDDFFTRNIDAALRHREIDLALHSAKDLPEQLAADLRVAALTPSFAPWDCLVSRDGRTLSDLPEGARVGTSSGRRREALLALRPDARPLDIRGNVPDRLRQLDDGHYDALILAAAGLVRLGLEHRIAQTLSLDEAPPAPGQGALAVVARSADTELAGLLAAFDLGDRRGMPWRQA